MVAARRPDPDMRRWIDDLATGDAARTDAAKDALVERGAAAVPHLVALLDAEGPERLHAISLLSLLSDPRAAAPLGALLHDASARVRQRAAGALARLPSPATVPALSRLLERETSVQVRQVTARSLVRLLRGGHDEALHPLLLLVADETEPQRVRVIALDAVPWITLLELPRPAGAHRLLERLAGSGAPAVARKARRLLDSPPRLRLEPWEIERLVDALGSRSHATWRRAVTLLGAAGGSIVDPLVRAMLARPRDRELASRAALVLKALSPRSLGSLSRWIDEVREPVVLEALVDVAAQAGSRALLARLAALIRRLGTDRDDGLLGVRCRAHLALARSGSRLAAGDLRELLDACPEAVCDDLCEAASRVGTREELPVLFRAYRSSRGHARLGLREAVVTIARRERLRRNDRWIAKLDGPERRAAREILGLPNAGPRNRGRLRGAHVDTPSGPLLT